MTDLLQAQDEALDMLRTLKIQLDGSPQDQYITSEWQPMKIGDDIWIRHVAPRLSDGRFTISCVHALQGVHLRSIKLEQDVLFVCVSGSLLINGLQFGPGSAITIPANTEHSFLALEECYTVVNFLFKEREPHMSVVA